MTRIHITSNPRFSPLRTLRGLAICVAMTGFGTAIGSNAMEWLGFVLLCLLAVVVAATGINRQGNMTIAEARALLDKIEADEIKVMK